MSQDRKPIHPPDQYLKTLINDLELMNISVHDAIERTGLDPVPVSALHALVVEHPGPYVRLFAAWALGKLGAVDDLELLCSAYAAEENPDARANIAWALATTRADELTLSFYETLLRDAYRHVPLVALRYLAHRPAFVGRLDFVPTYEAASFDTLVKAELVRRLTAFRHDAREIASWIQERLEPESNEVLVAALLAALGSLPEHGLKILMEYAETHRRELARSQILALEVATSFRNLCQSRAAPVLEWLFWTHTSLAVRWRIVEALASGGGPDAHRILRDIHGAGEGAELQPVVRESLEMTFTTPKTSLIIRPGVPSSQQSTLVEAGGRRFTGTVWAAGELLHPSTGWPIL